MQQWSANVTEYGKKIWQRTAFWRSGTGLTILVVACVSLRLLWIHLQRPAHLKEITAAYGAASLFYGTPQMDHAGTEFTFVKTSDFGYGLFICDAITGQKEVICEEIGQGRQHDTPDINALPWAPDDSVFLYTITNKLMTYAPDTKQSTIVMDVETNVISDLVWVNPTEFAYITFETNLFYVQKQDNGGWQQQQLLSRPHRMSSLAAVGDDAVAWLEENVICKADLSALTGDEIDTNSVANNETNRLTPPTQGLALWLDASTLRRPDQALVMGMPDLSGNKKDAVWNGRPPVFNGTNSVRALNGKPTIHFASVNSSTNGTGLKTHTRAGITGSAPRSVFVVMRHDLHRSMMVNMGDTAGKGTLFSIEWTNNLYLPAGWKADNRIKMASTNWSILEVVYDGKHQKGYVNGILRGMTTNKLNTADKEIEIGFRTSTGGKNARAAEGDFAELLVYDVALTSPERKQAEAYLASKWFNRTNSDATAQNPYLWFVPPVDGVIGFKYSTENGIFLLNSSEARHGSLWKYDPQMGNLTLVTEGGTFQNEQWFGDNQCAYIQQTAKHNDIGLLDQFGVENEQLEGKKLRWFGMMPDTDKLLVLGMVTNEPSAGIWEYDLTTKKMTAIVPYSDYPSIYAREIVPFDKVIKTSWGTNLVATVFPPANFNPHKKYPLVIGDTRFIVAVNGVHGRQWVPCIADEGAYVVIVERKGWTTGIENWSDDILAAYHNLAHDLHIDTSQIYLFGSSAETSHMDQVITNSPGLWKGIILLNPGKLPDLSTAHFLQNRPKLLISVGRDENEEDRLKKYQQEALKAGMIVEFIVHPGEGHHIVNNIAQLDRTKAIMNFIFGE